MRLAMRGRLPLIQAAMLVEKWHRRHAKRRRRASCGSDRKLTSRYCRRGWLSASVGAASGLFDSRTPHDAVIAHDFRALAVLRLVARDNMPPSGIANRAFRPLRVTIQSDADIADNDQLGRAVIMGQSLSSCRPS